MSNVIYGNMVGGGAAPLKTLILTDENGNEFFGVVTDSEQILTANASTDIREGTVAVTDEGIVTGSKYIPAYHTQKGTVLIKPNSEFNIGLANRDAWDYTALQAMLAPYNGSLSKSVAVDRVVVESQLYPVQSTIKESDVVKDADNKSISFGLTNGDTYYVVRYFTYKEEL